MFGEYGYMEEGKLGKPYNLRLLRRLIYFALPYKKTIVFALLMSILITLCDLALPYFTKIAIDRYIISSWHAIDTEILKKAKLHDIIPRYGHFLIRSRINTIYFISDHNLKKIDPADLHALKEQEALSPERYYNAVPSALNSTELQKGSQRVLSMADGTIMLSYETFYLLPKEDILKIRAGDIRGVSMVGGLVFVLLIASFGLSWGEYYLLEFTGQNMMQDIRLKLFKTMLSQSLRFYGKQPVGRLVTRTTNDIENLNEMFKSVMVTMFKDFFILLGIIIILLHLNLRLALVCFSLIPFIFVFTFIFGSIARDAFRKLRTKTAQINAFLQERITGMRIIQLFAREQTQMKAFKLINHENYLAGMKQIRVFALFMPIVEIISSFAIALLIWHGGGKVIGDQLSLGSLVAFISYIQMFFKPVRDISEKYNIMQSAMASTERIFEFMDKREEIPEDDHPFISSKIKGEIDFKDVSFSYEDGHTVLRDISFKLRPGETLAIVGATGSGKTTLVNLVERFYDPDKGQILLDGIDLKRWSKDALRKNISLCMQDIFIFNGNIVDNISLGRDWITAKNIETAVRRANALPFIERLPDRFRQEIGEGGGTLSAGEQQLLSFARALAADPKVLILDEATSNVDPETERLIQKAISVMAANRTTLIIAHRLSTIKNADKIIVMHHGRVVERGTHEELIALRAVYYRLNRLRNGNLIT